ncbi:HD domain-containing phosphohydrolase [Denitratisoma oestradiolicum]|uniref:Response regulator containing a CheY-like receiver domain and an HD-GYP domain n=1 Tax=Denitratisoma oestradiolicum TaxID=311182 RepID=A0A6S6Y254_9PROT|nr:HD domain-containing phosphohydrolase [Denitratisoma oestradiolicum]TWO79109.1 two-component system response regulator [Denitratisoma oestradiolicum]CAB1371021.1 Response regulator containing a CheY-like receiver domain and an HD-GYP domain [Denitratisoma oestradiolicum]
MTDAAETEKPATLLCVDDEANILSALKRLFRPTGYRILTAGSGAEGLRLLEEEAGNIDLVISDMRMPEMDGTRFLSQVRQSWPDVIRILLTGFAEIDATVAAINEGQIYRYIAKPWNDSDVLLTVRDALAHRALSKEKARLEALTRQQNEELRNLNTSLEEKVQARTQELRQLNEQLKRNFFTSIQVFSNLTELREGYLAGHSSRVAAFARKLANDMGLSEKDSQDVFLAALLHDIGKIGLPDDLLNKPVNQMNGEEFGRWRRHPIKGEQALMALEELRDVAGIIRAHHERFDGEGYPDGLSGLTIPLGARILAVVNEFDGLVHGNLIGKRLPEQEARQFIAKARGKRYDPTVVDAFLGKAGKADALPPEELELSTLALMPGMRLARPVLNREGIVLLMADYVLSENLILQLRDFEKTDGTHLTIYVRPPKP